jgi:hypothetical protein
VPRDGGGAGLLGRWTLPGLEAGPVRVGSGHGLGPIRLDRFSFFSNLFLMRKQIPEKSRNCLKSRKILRKSQKFQENDMKNPNKAFGAHEKDFRAF